MMSNDTNKRIVGLIAYPKKKTGELKSLFTNEEGSIKRKLEDPPTGSGKIRYAGWSLETLDQGKIIDGQFVRVKNGNKRIIDLYNDGTLIFSGLADEDFLSWASDDGLKIHSMALIELVYNFVSFYKEVIDDFLIKPKIIFVEFKFINMWLNDKKNYIIPGPVRKWPIDKKYEAQKNDFSDSIEIPVENFSADKLGKIAYDILKKIYLKFGVPIDSGNIPYTKEENDIISVDIEQIRKAQ